MQITDCQPDSGNPTVRDERGAYGNVSYGGIRNPLHKLKRCMSETLCLRLRAPYFYPTTRACRHRGSLETWESQWFPCRESGVGVPTGEVKTPGAGRKLAPPRRALQEQGTQSKTSATRYRCAVTTDSALLVTRIGFGGNPIGQPPNLMLKN